MAIRTYLQGLGATHLFDLDNNGTLTTDDLGNSSTPTNIAGGNYTFDTDPVCEGVTHSLDVVASTNPGTYGANFTSQNDINLSLSGWNTDKRSLLIWCKQSDIQNPTCIYEQGANVNNFALMGGALATFQAADAGQPFLIVQSKSLTQQNRPYLFVGVWEYHTQHAGSGNRILFYINGILQGISELTGTDPFPNHSGGPTCGNSGDNLRSFAGTTFTSQTTEKNCNFLGMFNNISLTEAQCREIFERTTFANQTIAADTVANQQAALDAIIGTTYENENCAIRIIQATDATNYRLFVDNITFNVDPNLEDISVQFVGTGTLILENTNGTVIKYTSTPTEVETTSATYTGGGSIVVVNNTKRVTTDQTITNPQDDKIVFDGSGSNYTIDGGIVPVIENVSGNTVTVSLINEAPTPTLLETDGSFIVEQSVDITAPNIIDDSRVQIYNVTKGAELDNSVVSGGSGYSFTVNLSDASIDSGDTIRLRATYQTGVVAMEEIEVSGVVTSSGLTFTSSQTSHEVFDAYGVDGSTITEFSFDSGNIEVDINDTNNTTEIQRLACWETYFETTEQGVRDFFGCIRWESLNSIKIEVAVCDLKLDNVKVNPLQITGGRLYRSDGTTVISSGSNSIQIDYEPVYIGNADDITEIKATIDANLDATVSSRASQTSVNNLPLSVPTVPEIVDGVFDEIV
jgi:hypothetical protein